MGTRHSKFGWWKDQQGKVINAETLTVTLTGVSTVATIYEASAGGSAISNGQITLSSVGYFKFWVDEDDYPTTQRFRLTFTGGKFNTITLDDVAVFDGGITASSSDTFTNKTIDADDNTISNLEIGNEIKSTVVTADLNLAGLNLDDVGVMFLKEQAEADANVAGSGQLWVDTAAPNVLMFTDDDDTDFRLSYTPTGSGNLVLATSPTIASPVLNTAISGTAFLDQDAMDDDSATKVSSQQAIKKYVDDNTVNIGSESTTTGGTSIVFGSIPAGVTKITMMIHQISTTSTSPLEIQIGDIDGIENSGYTSVAGSSGASTNSTNGFIIMSIQAAAGLYSGAFTLYLQNSASFRWVGSGGIGRTNATDLGSYCSGSKALSKELTQISITTDGGSDTIDVNGGISIQYE